MNGNPRIFKSPHNHVKLCLLPLSGHTDLPRAGRRTCKARLSILPCDPHTLRDAKTQRRLMHIVYLWHKGQCRRIYIVYWHLPSTFNQRARPRPNCVDSIPHSRHARPSGVLAQRAPGCAFAVLSWLAGRSHDSIIPHEGKRVTSGSVIYTVCGSWRGHQLHLLTASGNATEAPFSHLHSPHLLPHHGTGRKKRKKKREKQAS